MPSPKDRGDRSTGTRKRMNPRDAGIRKRNCHFCREKVEEVDYKNINQLRRYISEKGKIRSRRITGACRRRRRLDRLAFLAGIPRRPAGG